MKIKIHGMLLLLLLSLMFSSGCNKSSTGNTTQSSAQNAQSSAKHYQLKGKVVSIDKRAKMANIDAEAIPGFMDSMTMPYTVKPEGELDKLQSGDQITGDLVVDDDNSWIENIVVTGHAATGNE